MRALLQRVSRAEVRVAGEPVGAIGRGLLVLLGVAPEDDDAAADALARRVVELRIHEDRDGRTNLALGEIGGAVLVVSQFTLYGDVWSGRRPSFVRSAGYEDGERLYDLFVDALRPLVRGVETGVFGAHMEVELVNDGPVTLVIDAQ